MKRPCLDCGVLTTGSRCPQHRAQQERQRGTTTQRGYGSQHQTERQRLEATLPQPCGYCGVLIIAGDRWDAAHVEDGRPELGLMVAHPQCNQRAKGRG